jgi:hypothetical protein
MLLHIVHGRGAREGNFFRGGGETVGIFGKFLAKGWGYPFFGQGEKINGENDRKLCLLTPFCTCMA